MFDTHTQKYLRLSAHPQTAFTSEGSSKYHLVYNFLSSPHILLTQNVSWKVCVRCYKCLCLTPFSKIVPQSSILSPISFLLLHLSLPYVQIWLSFLPWWGRDENVSSEHSPAGSTKLICIHRQQGTDADCGPAHLRDGADCHLYTQMVSCLHLCVSFAQCDTCSQLVSVTGSCNVRG